MNLVSIIGIPLVITIAVEELLSLTMGRRGINRVLAVAAANMATNPVLNFILYIIGLFRHVPRIGLIVILLEAIVVIVEWRIYSYLFPETKKGSLVYSLILNTGSYLFGLVLFR